MKGESRETRTHRVKQRSRRRKKGRVEVSAECHAVIRESFRSWRLNRERNSVESKLMLIYFSQAWSSANPTR